MAIDSKRLKNDSADAQVALATNGHARRRTGATAVIEPVLPLIRELRARKYSWAAIAAALAKQGVVQGVNREPITARRLTALISAINKRMRRSEDRSSARILRRDIAPVRASSHNLTLSSDLQRTARAPVNVSDSEETLRHREFEGCVRSLTSLDNRQEFLIRLARTLDHFGQTKDLGRKRFGDEVP